MPNLANAKKALRQSEKRAARNKTVKDEIASLRRHFKTAMKDKKAEEAKKLALSIATKLDKATTKHVFKKNTAARLKSRMMLAVNKMAK